MKDIRSRRDQAGYTLIELLAAITILAMITGAMTAAFITTNDANANVSTSLHQSNDAQIIAGYWTADAQAAGGTDPNTGTKDSTLGVSTTDDGGCSTGSDTLVARFKWREWASRDSVTTKDTYTTRVANYTYSASTHELARRTCANGVTKGVVTLATRVQGPPTIQCVPSSDCPGLPDQVRITVSELTDATAPTPYSFTLTASLRAVGMSAPSGDASASTPLLALGSGTCSGGTTGLSVSGNQTVNVNGQAVVDAVDVGACHAMTVTGSVNYTAGGTSILAGGSCTDPKCPLYTTEPVKIGDPYAYLDPPTSGGCSGTNPSPSGGHYSPGTYPQALSITSNTPLVFDAGTYTFCNGLSFGAQSVVTANGVLFYVKGGAFSVSGGATLSLGAPTTGAYKGVLLWYAPSAPGVAINGGSNTTNYGGAIYAPNATVTISGGQSLAIGSIVAKIIVFTGGGQGSTDILGGDPTKPSSPALTATTSTTTLRQVHLSWTVPGYTGTSAIARYQYRADRGGSGYGAWTDVPGGLVTSYDDTCGTSDTVATSCTYQVRAVNGSGAGVASNQATASSLADSGAPTVTITAPTTNGRTGLTATISGSAGTAVGDATTVTVKLYGAANCTGSFTTLNAAVSGTGAWSVGSGTMTAGAKSVCVTQTDWLGNVGSAGPVNFTAGHVSNVTVSNGGALGRIDNKDVIAITFAQPMNESTICSAWTTNVDQSMAGNNVVTVTVTDGGVGNDTLTVSSTACPTLNFGTFDLGSPGWVNATTQFKGNGGNASALSYTAATNTFTITLGTGSGSGANVATQTMTYVPSSQIKDQTGNAMAGSYSFPGLRF